MPRERRRRKWENNIKMDLQESWREHGIWIKLAQDIPVPDLPEHGNDPYISLKEGIFWLAK